MGALAGLMGGSGGAAAGGAAGAGAGAAGAGAAGAGAAGAAGAAGGSSLLSGLGDAMIAGGTGNFGSGGKGVNLGADDQPYQQSPMTSLRGNQSDTQRKQALLDGLKMLSR